MRLHRAPDVGAVDGEDGTVYAAVLPDGPILVLSGTAALVWHAATGIGVEDLPAALSGRGADAADPAPFAAALVDAGLLILQEDS